MSKEYWRLWEEALNWVRKNITENIFRNFIEQVVSLGTGKKVYRDKIM
jgi:hypothetical protein